MKNFSRSEKVILVCILVYSFIPTFGGLLRVGELMDMFTVMPPNPRAASGPALIIIHVISSFIFCIIGAFQFIPSHRKKSLYKHKRAGKLVFAAGLLSAFTGLCMTHFYAFPLKLQGNLLYWSRLVLGTSMIVLIIKSIFELRLKRFTSHGHYILRAYAIGQGASTQTFLGITYMIVVAQEMEGSSRDLMMVCAWLINILFAEYLIRKTKLWGRST